MLRKFMIGAALVLAAGAAMANGYVVVNGVAYPIICKNTGLGYTCKPSFAW